VLPRVALLALGLALGLALATPYSARAQIAPTEYAARRAALGAGLDDGVLLAVGAPEPAHDYETFEQTPAFNYLTGFHEPDAALVMVKRAGKLSTTLFVQPHDAAREVWTGTRLGPAGASERTGLPARPATELRPALDSLLRTVGTLYVVGDVGGTAGGANVQSADDQLVAALHAAHPKIDVIVANSAVERLRGTKSAAELALIRKAVDVTVAAQREAIRMVKPGQNEFEVQALIEYTFRRNGADRPSFATIVGSGPNATTLHYNTDDRFMAAGDVLVMDIGASYHGYAADVTRTVPVSGTFTPEQRAVYAIVRQAQAAAEHQAKLGAQAALMSDSATAVLAAGLTRLGLIESPGAVYDCGEEDVAVAGGGARGAERTCPQYALYYMHGLGHGIGLEVHDPEQFYLTGVIAPGSAFTIEPGLYVRANLLEILPNTARNRALIAKIRPAVQRYRNIGIRIEDDYVVTDKGVEWISRAPREADELEELMREPYAGPGKRDAAMVEQFRQIN
jgi:Xaa-Pro aminopeptidase